VPPGGIVVDNPVVQVGGEVAFSGSGCEANEPLQIFFDGHPIGTISADPSGKFAGSISIPPGTAPGAHSLSVRGANCSFNATITVQGGNLAFTGSSSHTTTYVLGALAAIMVGFVLVVSSRRRRNGVRGRRLQPPTAA
jgi:LPXTG-motif cell wall-anchored protein